MSNEKENFNEIFTGFGMCSDQREKRRENISWETILGYLSQVITMIYPSIISISIFNYHYEIMQTSGKLSIR